MIWKPTWNEKSKDLHRSILSSPVIEIIKPERICGKGVGLGLFPSDSLESQSHEFIEIVHIGP